MKVRKLRSREVVPRTEFPNFRDHGKTVDRALLEVVGSLQSRHGESFASEGGLRRMICQDEGNMPGPGTLPKALARLEAQGLLTQIWLRPGGILPDGRVCTYGTRLVRLAVNRRERRAYRRLAITRDRRDGVTNRVQRGAFATLAEARQRIAAAVPETADARELAAQRKRAEDLARLAELGPDWEHAELDRPPD